MKFFYSLLIALSATSIVVSGCSNSSNQTEQVLYQNPYQEYMDKVDSTVSALDQEQKSKRDDLLLSLNSNDIYKKLVEQQILSTEYLEILFAVSQGIERTTSEMYSFEEEPFSSIVNSDNSEAKKEFIVQVVALGMDVNGGLPKDILVVFDNYQQKFGFYGARGSVISNGNEKIDIPVNFDLTGILSAVCPKNEAVLDAVFEARTSGITNWTKLDEAEHKHLTSMSDYMAHLKEFYSNSEHYVNPNEEVSANQLYTAYEKNEVKAKKDFQDKSIVVTGTISDFGIDVLDMPYISFKISSFKAVTCYFEDNKTSKIAELSKGEKVSILGTCRGNTLGNIVIDNCSFWE